MKSALCSAANRSPIAVALFTIMLTATATTNFAEGTKELPLDVNGSVVPEPWKRYGDWPGDNWSKFNTLDNLGASPPVAQRVSISGEITGNPENGRKLMLDRKRGGSCVACHVIPGADLPGNVGPDLSMVGTWNRSDEWLYNNIFDPRMNNPNTVMPPWGTHQVFSPDEIKDIVSYLKTLNEAAEFSNPLDDPAKRTKDEPERDNLDPVENPGMATLELGQELFHRAGPMGKSCADCHTNPTDAFKTWAAHMPRFEARLNKVMNIAEFVARHARPTTGDQFLLQSAENLALSMYLVNLANGESIAVDIESPGAKEAAERGRVLMEKGKIGQLNFACYDCHVISADKWIRGQYLTPHQTQLGWHPYYRTSRGEIWDLTKRMQWCGVSVRSNELLPDAREYGDIELYLAHLNSGRKLNSPGIGH